jgi:hypothetical protein
VLSSYITQVRRLLHDKNGQYWSDTDLTDYINEARNRVCKDSRCLRINAEGIVTLTQGVEKYPLSSVVLPSYASGWTIIDVMGVTVLWGTTRIKLAYLNWSRFDAQFRYWSNMQSRPICFSRMGTLDVYVGPVPDQSYTSDWDLACIPPALSSDSTPEPIAEPFTTPVKYYAAYLAKFQEQALGEAKMFGDMYTGQIRKESSAYMGRVIEQPYAR